jgi:hypothetical protein
LWISVFGLSVGIGHSQLKSVEIGRSRFLPPLIESYSRVFRLPFAASGNDPPDFLEGKSEANFSKPPLAGAIQESNSNIPL